MCVFAIVGAVAYKLPGAGGPGVQLSANACSGTPRDLEHALQESIDACTQTVGQVCPLVCEPGYGGRGTLRCGPGVLPESGNASCSRCEEHVAFSADGGECMPCSQCIGIVATACTATADTRCAVWNNDRNEIGPANLAVPFHLPQYAAIFDHGETTYAFGGVRSPTPATAWDGYEQSQ